MRLLSKIVVLSVAAIMNSYVHNEAHGASVSGETIICNNAVYLRCDLARDGQVCADDKCNFFSIKVTPRGKELNRNFQPGRDQGRPIVISDKDRNSLVISPKWELSSWDSHRIPLAEAFGVTYFKDNAECVGLGSGILNINRHLGKDKNVNETFIKEQIDSLTKHHKYAIRSFGLISYSGKKAFDICFKIKKVVTAAELYLDLLDASTKGNPLPHEYELKYMHQLN